MPHAIDRASLDRLIARGRERSHLTADDLRAELPVGAMSVDDLVLVILELEEAGVAVEPDVLGPRPASLRTELTLPPPPAVPVVPAARAAPEAASLAGRTGSGAAPEPARAARDEAAGIDRLVGLAGLAAFLILALVVLLI